MKRARSNAADAVDAADVFFCTVTHLLLLY